MNTLSGIGKIIPQEAQAFRDAIHIAILPCTAGTDLPVGAHVGLVPWAEYVSGKDPVIGWCDDPFGVVDPFLKEGVKAGERFFLWIYPDTITSLRHVWSLPALQSKLVPRPVSPMEEDD